MRTMYELKFGTKFDLVASAAHSNGELRSHFGELRANPYEFAILSHSYGILQVGFACSLSFFSERPVPTTVLNMFKTFAVCTQRISLYSLNRDQPIINLSTACAISTRRQCSENS